MKKKIRYLLIELKWKFQRKFHLFVLHALYGKNIRKGRRVSWLKYQDFGLIQRTEDGSVVILFWDSSTGSHVVEKVSASNLIYQNRVHTYDTNI